MKKFKVLLMLALLPFFAVTLSGCGDSEDSSSDYDSEQTTDEDDDDDETDEDSDYYSDDEADSDYDMDEEVDEGAKAYYGEDSDEYEEFSEWHDQTD